MRQFNHVFCLAIFFSAILLVFAPGNSLAADEVGTSVRIKNQVTGSLGNRSLKPRDPVFTSERIHARSNSHGEILLKDNSRVLVGENSTISLDDFVVGRRGFSSGSIRIAKGAFRFITGNSSKGAIKVASPVSTIGIRGTVFDVYVAPSGITRVILFNGEVEVCSRSNCITTSNPCDIVEVDRRSAVELPYLRSGDRAEESASYDLTTLQGRFLPGWRAPTVVCDTRAAFDPSRKRDPAPEREIDKGEPVDPAERPGREVDPQPPTPPDTTPPDKGNRY